MTVKINEYELTCQCQYKLYDVILDDEIVIETTVTHDPAIVSSWIDKTEILNESRLHRLIVGLDIEWRPNFTAGQNNPAATIQLCVGKSCLIYQIIHSANIPRRLRQFLQKETYEFVGVGIESDVKKLNHDYGLLVSKKVDLRKWAAAELKKKELLTAGLKDLVKKIVGKEIVKPKSVTMSAWDQRRLSPKQICYACLDAYLSFEIGRILSAWYD
ncbi:3'-5' exonuclease-like [Nicotiana tabacum]|uniref:3'-5' exonuclease-like n=2 Tax=Nicotiana TaxID=4085 RepID=A0A1S4AGV1_TOBAC|nr:PREDICTED: Werner Syndrome-like exonuclease [Nicotiana sylvestris]XP_016475844.1 PREDICTED: Werner Syndrome-like exonuclease [Nicotiana tabacum]